MRDCRLPLARRAGTFTCPRGHTYDIARSGYVNLLQPQDRRSQSPGDSKAAVAARARLIESGVGREVLQQIVGRAATLALAPDPVVVDLGSGTGDALAMLAGRLTCRGMGIDLSTAAAEHAARRFRQLTWVVANADRRLPLLDDSVDLILSLHGRRNPNEAARVLKHAGCLLVAVPAPDDLVELRQFVQGEAAARERISALLSGHERAFVVVDRFEARTRARLEREMLLDLLRATYRGERTSVADRIADLTSLDVTLASECVVMKPSRP